MHHVLCYYWPPQEFDTPYNLYQSGGLFRGMCDRSNITSKDIEIARMEAEDALFELTK